MTCHVDDYPYGHAGCCRCERDLDLSCQPAGLTWRKGNLLVYFFYCADCAADLAAKDQEGRGHAELALDPKWGREARDNDGDIFGGQNARCL